MRPLLVTSLLLVGSLFGANSAWGGDDSLLLRMQDSVGTPGSQAVLSLRTYASRPVGQGQICFSMSTALRGGAAFGDIKGFKIFSSNDDVKQNIIVSRGVNDLTVILQFISPSATINAEDGPLAAVFFEVDAALVPGAEFDIVLDVANTVLIDENGQSILLETRDGQFSVRDPALPLRVSADADQAVPGGAVRMSFQTNEPFDIGSGQVAIRYSSRLFPTPPQLHMDPRYGFVSTKPDGYPGLAIFRIVAIDNSFNDLPGDVFQMFVQPHPGVGSGVISDVIVDPALTQLWAPDGTLLSFEFEPGEVEVE